MGSRVLLGPHAVREALRARRDVAVVYVEAAREDGDVSALARACGVRVERRARVDLDALARGGRHQGLVALADEYPYASLDEMLDAAGHPPLLLLLDGIQDPQNLGALVRSACVLGVDGVVIPRDRAARVTAAVVRASAGATEHVRIARVTNLARTVEQLARRDLRTVAAVTAGGTAPWDLDLRGPLALVVGAEGRGVRRLVAERCDERVTLPAGRIAALNASAAGAVMLYEAARQRSVTRSPGQR